MAYEGRPAPPLLVRRPPRPAAGFGFAGPVVAGADDKAADAQNGPDVPTAVVWLIAPPSDILGPLERHEVVGPRHPPT